MPRAKKGTYRGPGGNREAFWGRKPCRSAHGAWYMKVDRVVHWDGNALLCQTAAVTPQPSTGAPLQVATGPSDALYMLPVLGCTVSGCWRVGGASRSRPETEVYSPPFPLAGHLPQREKRYSLWGRNPLSFYCHKEWARALTVASNDGVGV